MQIETMSAEELAKVFSEQNQNQSEVKPIVNEPIIKFDNIVTSKSSEELAKDAIQNPIKPDLTGKTPEELEAIKKAEEEKQAEESKRGRPKTKLDDSFKQGLDKLFKEQKLDPYSDGTEEGYIVPDTWEEVVELIEDNKKNWIETSKAKDKEELMNEILSTKSPAWQFLLQNSETYRDPSELIPLLTAVQNIEYSNSLDATNTEDQEKIIRATLSIQGLSATDIESEIDDLKSRDAMEKRAVALKPILDRYNESQTDRILQQKELEESKKEKFWNSYYNNLEDSVFKAKEIDGVKLKNEHKQLIASTLIPDEEIGGLPIYTIIDNLVAQGNFKVLSKIALLGLDEKLFDSYFLTKRADKVADNIQKTLRQSGTSSNTTEFEQETKPKTIRKNSYGYFG